ncbi:SRPBCC family protein [Mycobacterium colombiense]|uniref:Cyclase/dehydrase n=2 Tax=Mycobacterium colombiense TaxID=339268 RepID=J4JTZ6_9MYCO|nr:cyclase/dehydrase [Mycobacterium colombiense CECT 3035]
MEALTDVGVLSSWSPLHKHIEVIDRYPDGRPHHVKTTIKIFGLVDKEVLEYHWGPDWVVYDATGTSQQHGQHVEYTLKPEGIDQTRVRFDVTVEPGRPMPAFIVRRAAESVLDSSVKGLCELVKRVHGSSDAE